jgi:hypothetical protein
LDVVTITKSSELFLSGGIPNIELDGSTVGVENEGMDLYSQGSNILLLEFSCKMALYKSSFTNSTISNKDELKFWNFLSL